MNKAIVVVLSLRLVAVRFGKLKNLFLSPTRYVLEL